MDVTVFYGLVFAMFGTSWAISVDYFPTKCNGKASILTSHKLESSIGLRYSNNMDCTFTVTAPSNRRIVARFQRFDLETKINGSCVDYVNIHDGVGISSSRLNADPLCGTLHSTIYNSTKSSMTAHMITDDTGTAQGFALIFTVVYEGSCGGDFRCNNSFCIARDLECNGLDQCGDNSDELACSAEDLLLRYGKDHAPMIAGIVLGLLAVGIIAVIIGMYVYKRNKWRRFLNDNDAEDDAIWEIESAYPVTQRYFKGNRGKPNYNTLNEHGEAQPAMADNDTLPRDIDISGEASTSNTNV